MDERKLGESVREIQFSAPGDMAKKYNRVGLYI